MHNLREAGIFTLITLRCLFNWINISFREFYAQHIVKVPIKKLETIRLETDEFYQSLKFRRR